MPLGLFRGTREFNLTPAESGADFHMREEYPGPLLRVDAVENGMPVLNPSFEKFCGWPLHRNGRRKRMSMVTFGSGTTSDPWLLKNPPRKRPNSRLGGTSRRTLQHCLCRLEAPDFPMICVASKEPQGLCSLRTKTGCNSAMLTRASPCWRAASKRGHRDPIKPGRWILRPAERLPRTVCKLCDAYFSNFSAWSILSTGPKITELAIGR